MIFNMIEKTNVIYQATSTYREVCVHEHASRVNASRRRQLRPVLHELFESLVVRNLARVDRALECDALPVRVEFNVIDLDVGECYALTTRLGTN